jgi:hypothetical protein
MHRAQNKQKTIRQEGHNSLCPYKKIYYFVIVNEVTKRPHLKTKNFKSCIL